MQSLGCESRTENRWKTYLKLLWNGFSGKTALLSALPGPAVLSPRLLEGGCPAGGGNQARAEPRAGRHRSPVAPVISWERGSGESRQCWATTASPAAPNPTRSQAAQSVLMTPEGCAEPAYRGKNSQSTPLGTAELFPTSCASHQGKQEPS